MLNKLTANVTNRRAFLSGAALLAGGLALAGCSSTQIASAETTWNQVVDAVQSGVSTAAAYIPTVESIAAAAAGLFGTQYQSLVTLGSAALNQVIASLVGAIGSLTPVVASAVRRRLATSSRGLPVPIGVIVTPAGQVAVNGYKAA